MTQIMDNSNCSIKSVKLVLIFDTRHKYPLFELCVTFLFITL